MSIAVSAVVKPSKLLFCMVAFMSVVISLLGIVIGLGGLLELAPIQGWAYAITSIFLANFGFYCAVKSRKTHHIDITGIGQIRLAEYRPSEAKDSVVEYGDYEIVTLLPDSTLWPHLLILRLKRADKRKINIHILRDSVGLDAFRAISLACRWIVVRNQQVDTNYF